MDSNGKKSNEKKYVDVKEDIFNMIKSGELKVGDKLPSRAELTARYHISDSTCKKVLYSLMQENVLEGSQGKGVFVRSPVSIREVKKLAFVIWKGREILNHPSFSQTAHGIIQGASDIEHQLTFTFINPNVETHLEIEKKIFQTDANAFIFSYIPGFDEKILLPMIRRNVPVITIGWKMKNSKCFSITDDLDDAIYSCILRLLNAGKKRIAYLGSPAHGLLERRLLAFKRAFSERALPLDMSLIKVGKEQSLECGEMLCGDMLGSSVPEVIFADDDNICSGVLKHLRKHGITKTDINVVRIGNEELKMPVPTISVPWSRMGTVAAELINKIESGCFPKERNIIVPCHIDM